MNITPKQPFELTPEQQEKLNAAGRATLAVSSKTLPIDEETAKLIALPLDKRSDAEAIIRASFATKLRVGGRWTAKASGVCLPGTQAAASVKIGASAKGEVK